MSYISRDYQNIINYNKSRFSYFSSLSREYQFIPSGGSIVDFGPNRTHPTSQKFDFGIYRHDGGFWTPQCH